MLTVSDSCARRSRRDESGRVVARLLAARGARILAREVVADDERLIASRLRRWCAGGRVDFVLSTGGTGLGPRDVTPEATLAVADKELPGFGEQMRRISLEFVPTAILSRQVAVVRKGALILNLPGQPKSIRETLEGARDADGKPRVAGIFAAVPYCVDLIGGPYLETREEVVKAFRPKSALRTARP